MQQFEVDNSSLIEKKNEKDEKGKKKISFKIIGIVFIICFSIFFIYIYINNAKLLEEEKEKNDDLKQIVKDLIKERNQTRKTIEDLIKWKENNENIEEDYSDYVVDSLIFNNKDIRLISDRLTNKEELKDKNVIFNLLYRASRDGADANSYHKRCDGKANTVSVVQTVKGNKFGGYTETQIENGNMGFKDPNSFVFSLNKQKIYENLNKDGDVIRHYKGYGPYYVGGFITFDSQFYSNNNNYIYDRSSSSNFFSNNEKEYEINNGEQFFAIRELEVFEIFLE